MVEQPYISKVLIAMEYTRWYNQLKKVAPDHELISMLEHPGVIWACANPGTDLDDFQRRYLSECFAEIARVVHELFLRDKSTL